MSAGGGALWLVMRALRAPQRPLCGVRRCAHVHAVYCTAACVGIARHSARPRTRAVRLSRYRARVHSPSPALCYAGAPLRH
eukprot:scaffold10193_cov107-Isochrysis_galbana.AAC.12